MINMENKLLLIVCQECRHRAGVDASECLVFRPLIALLGLSGAGLASWVHLEVMAWSFALEF